VASVAAAFCAGGAHIHLTITLDDGTVVHERVDAALVDAEKTADEKVRGILSNIRTAIRLAGARGNRAAVLAVINVRAFQE
jgi:hypothetical protein